VKLRAESGISSRNGAGDGIRTRDIDLGKVALYQLSYSRNRRRIQLSLDWREAVKWN
jgi:hypothetical protein